MASELDALRHEAETLKNQIRVGTIFVCFEQFLPYYFIAFL